MLPLHGVWITEATFDSALGCDDAQSVASVPGVTWSCQDVVIINACVRRRDS